MKYLPKVLGYVGAPVLEASEAPLFPGARLWLKPPDQRNEVVKELLADVQFRDNASPIDKAVHVGRTLSDSKLFLNFYLGKRTKNMFFFPDG